MKKLLTITAILFAFSTSAHAFDFGSFFGGSKESADAAIEKTSGSDSGFNLGGIASGIKKASCAALAIDLVKSAGVGAMNLFTKLSADQALTATDLGISDKTLAEATGYISSGCAKDHLTQALSAVVN